MTEARKGEIAILTQVVLWGAFPAVVAKTYSQLPPMLTLSISSAFAALFIFFVLILKNKLSELKHSQAIKSILLMTLFNGIGYYCLYFFALKYTSPGNAALIALTENFTNFAFFHIFLKEEFSIKEVVGYAFTVFGAIMILSSGFAKMNIGNLLMVVASTIAPFGNYFMRNARKHVSSFTIIFSRNFLTAFAVFGLAVIFRENIFVVQKLSSINWLFLSLNGVVLLGFSKILWTEAIHRIPISKALALGNISPLFTLVFAYVLLHQKPSMAQLWSIPFLMFGFYILLRQKENAKES